MATLDGLAYDSATDSELRSERGDFGSEDYLSVTSDESEISATQ